MPMLQGTVPTSIQVSDRTVLGAAREIILQRAGLNDDHYINDGTLMELHDYGRGTGCREVIRPATDADKATLAIVKHLDDLQMKGGC